MTNRDSLYGLFGVPPACTDEELRQAYVRAVFQHHPDRNPNQLETATAKTQLLVSAFKELKDHRTSQSAEPQSVGSDQGIERTVGVIKVTFRFPFDDGVDVKDIVNRKTNLREVWEKFRQNPSDPVCALRMVHAAFRAGQQDSFKDLLLNPILVDSAGLLLSLARDGDVCETLMSWSEVLRRSQMATEAIQILEYAHATGMAPPSVANELLNLHYSWAQYADPTTGRKATPKVRIEHLRRLLEFGYHYDFLIYKFMAEAYHDLEDDEQARAYLRQAYALNPELPGAVRISRALGFSQSSEPSHRKTRSSSEYKYSRHVQIPDLAQVQEWKQGGNWDALIEFANPQDYSPAILPAAREILRQIASSLAGCESSKAIEVLTASLNFYYWDVSEAAMISLAKNGDTRTLDLLVKFKPTNSRGCECLAACISYLRARVSNQSSLTTKVASRKLLAQAKEAFANGDYGRTRILLENLPANVEQSDSIHLDATTLLARSCAMMNDFGIAVERIRPLWPKLSVDARRVISEEVASWLWNDLVFQSYTPLDDESYRLALEIHLELALMATTPNGVLKNLHRLTRWLELLGAGTAVQWIKQSIRDEAPGTWYVDRDNREQYIRSPDLSPSMRDYLTSLHERVVAHATARLKQVLKGTHTM